jgi:phage terminase large subunit-like protein
MANSITPKLKAGFVMLANEAEGANILISQMGAFPKGQNDDTVDGLIMTVKNGLNENGLLASG